MTYSIIAIILIVIGIFVFHYTFSILSFAFVVSTVLSYLIGLPLWFKIIYTVITILNLYVWGITHNFVYTKAPQSVPNIITSLHMVSTVVLVPTSLFVIVYGFIK